MLAKISLGIHRTGKNQHIFLLEQNIVNRLIVIYFEVQDAEMSAQLCGHTLHGMPRCRKQYAARLHLRCKGGSAGGGVAGACKIDLCHEFGKGLGGGRAQCRPFYRRNGNIGDSKLLKKEPNRMLAGKKNPVAGGYFMERQRREAYQRAPAYLPAIFVQASGKFGFGCLGAGDEGGWHGAKVRLLPETRDIYVREEMAFGFASRISVGYGLGG